MKGRLSVVLLLTVVCTVAALWGMAPSRLIMELRGLSPLAVLGVLLLYTGNFVLRAVRFRLLVPTPVPWMAMGSVVGVGFLAITVIPLRLGEFFRPYLLAERHGVPFGAGLAAVVAERILDLMALLLCCFVVAWGVVFPVRLQIGGLDVLAAGQTVVGMSAVMGLMLLGGVAWRGTQAVDGLVRRVPTHRSTLAERIQRNGYAFVEGISLLHARPGVTGAAVGMTALMWAFSAAGLMTMLWGAGVVHLSVAEMVGAWTVTVSATIALPTPASVGSFELGGAGALVALGLDADLARAVLVGLHAVTLLHTVMVGGVFLVLEGWSLRGLTRASQEALEDVSGAVGSARFGPNP